MRNGCPFVRKIGVLSVCHGEDSNSHLTELPIQELDLRFVDGCWSYHDFRGSRWCDINSPERRQYLRNAYRVLLARARQGMVIFVPPGDRDHPSFGVLRRDVVIYNALECQSSTDVSEVSPKARSLWTIKLSDA